MRSMLRLAYPGATARRAQSAEESPFNVAFPVASVVEEAAIGQGSMWMGPEQRFPRRGARAVTVAPATGLPSPSTTLTGRSTAASIPIQPRSASPTYGTSTSGVMRTPAPSERATRQTFSPLGSPGTRNRPSWPASADQVRPPLSVTTTRPDRGCPVATCRREPTTAPSSTGSGTGCDAEAGGGEGGGGAGTGVAGTSGGTAGPGTTTSATAGGGGARTALPSGSGEQATTPVRTRRKAPTRAPGCGVMLRVLLPLYCPPMLPAIAGPRVGSSGFLPLVLDGVQAAVRAVPLRQRPFIKLRPRETLPSAGGAENQAH